MTRSIRSLFIAIMLVGYLQFSCLALTNEEVFSQFQFNFITPGARATALGGAFIGLADDATAVESNPAGLTQLLTPEVSAEFKYINYTTEQLYENLPTRDNYNPETELWSGEITRKEFDDSVASVPFMSVVYPFKRFVLSLYRQELANYKSSYRTSAYPIVVPGTGWAILPVDASVDLIVTNYGLGAAIQLFENFSLAISPRWSRMNMKSHSTRFKPSPFSLSTPTDFSEDDIINETIIDDEDNGFGMNAGLMWSPHPRVSIGIVYRSGTTFTVTEKNGRKTSFNRLDPDSDYYDSDLAEFTLRVPASFGIGIAFRATDFLTFTLDEVHIRYEDLLEDFDFLFEQEEITKDDFIIENVTELHFGVEYILVLGKRLLALRAGVYNNPDHTIRYTGTLESEWGFEDRFQIERARFPGGDDQIHFTGGLGLVLNDRFQIDMAVDIADKKKQFSFSSIYRFGGRKPKIRDRKPAQTRVATPTPVEEVRPSLTFTVVMSEGAQGKMLEIEHFRTDARGVKDFRVAAKQVGATEFLIQAALKTPHEKFKADIRIEIEQDKMTIKKVDAIGQVTVISEKPDSLEIMIIFK